MTDNGTGGALAAALAKAQVKFGPVKRDKTVVVQKKAGGSYKFSYAPLDTILDAVRKPLADNGLVVVQLLDEGDLVTMLLHESGERLSGSIALPPAGDIQGLGSTITYLRRYAIQALLGIAAEEDDDGNRDDGGLIGTVEVGKPPVDMELRQTPDGAAWGFKLTSGRKGYQALAVGTLADVLAVSGLAVGTRVIVWGPIEMVAWQKGGKDMPPYARIHIERVQTPDWTLPASAGATETPEEAPEAPSVPLFDDMPLDDEEKALIAGGRR